MKALASAGNPHDRERGEKGEEAVLEMVSAFCTYTMTNTYTRQW